MPTTCCRPEMHRLMATNPNYFTALTSPDRVFEASLGVFRGYCVSCGWAVRVPAELIAPTKRFVTCDQSKHREMSLDARTFRENISGHARHDSLADAFCGECRVCNSSIYIAAELVLGPPAGKRVERCAACDGQKMVGKDLCDACDARGVVLVDETRLSHQEVR